MLRKKVCFIGADGVGKTSIILRKIKNTFSESYLPTLGCDFYEHTYNKDGFSDPLSIYIWDMASQSSFKKLQKHYLSFSHASIIVTDIKRISSKYIDPWLEATRKFSGEDVPCILVVNKLDLLEKSNVINEKIENIKSEYKFPIIRSSAKTGDNIEKIFLLLYDILRP